MTISNAILCKAEEFSQANSNTHISLYDELKLESRIKALGNPEFQHNGSQEVNHERFYNYAQIDKWTWQSIRDPNSRRKTLQKKTVLRLINALELKLDEAEALLEKFSYRFEESDMQDMIIKAAAWHRSERDGDRIDVDDIIETLQIIKDQEQSKQKFIYDLIWKLAIYNVMF